MNSPKHPGFIAGILVGILLAAALVAIYYPAWKLAGLPFVPFDVFDFMTRTLPGAVITFGIDSMVAVIRTLHIGPTAVVAKTAEQTMAVAGFLFTAIVASAILFAILRALGGRYAYPLGVAAGAILGIPILLISLYSGQTASASPWVSSLWILGSLLLWGFCLGFCYRRLSPAAVVIPPSPAPTVPPPSEPQPSGEPEPPTAEPSAIRLDRRRFLIRLGASTAVVTVAGAVVGTLTERMRQRMLAGGSARWSSNHPLPNANASVQPAPGTRREFTPLESHYRIDINTNPPVINEKNWSLRFTGLLDKPVALTLDDLRRYEPLHQFITLACISNPVAGDLTSTTRWTGVSLRRLLGGLHLKPSASHLKIRSADGFFEVVPLQAIHADERIMLTYAWDGVPLPAEHGFPLRIYIPDVYGMKQPKWIESIEVMDHWEPGYWVVRGWDKTARMKATSVIDTVSMNMSVIDAEHRTLIPIGGIAHAGARGISKVEVRIDEGPWEMAQLRTPISGLTWVVWRYDWPFQSGSHTFTVRCYDGSGAPQIETPSPVHPSGASGLHTRTQML
ncbi:MAG: molybdopterin-dependent oxidoreductase [Bacillota bacterium]